MVRAAFAFERRRSYLLPARELHFPARRLCSARDLMLTADGAPVEGRAHEHPLGRMVKAIPGRRIPTAAHEQVTSVCRRGLV
jgi:hypothetical protein